jgi:hypothetical protein
LPPEERKEVVTIRLPKNQVDRLQEMGGVNNSIKMILNNFFALNGEWGDMYLSVLQ